MSAIREYFRRLFSGRVPFQGSDPRTVPWLAAFFENLLLFASKVPPPFFTIEFLGLRAGIPWKLKSGEWGYWHFRAHVLRFDYYHGAYLSFSFMNKRVPVWEVAP